MLDKGNNSLAVRETDVTIEELGTWTLDSMNILFYFQILSMDISKLLKPMKFEPAEMSNYLDFSVNYAYILEG